MLAVWTETCGQRRVELWFVSENVPHILEQKDSVKLPGREILWVKSIHGW